MLADRRDKENQHSNSRHSGAAKGMFSDCLAASLSTKSSWRGTAASSAEASTQTHVDMYKFAENETQTGSKCEVIQRSVEAADKNTSLHHYLTKHYGAYGSKRNDYKGDVGALWRSEISNGNVTVDCEVCTDASRTLDTDEFVECTSSRRSAQTQTAGTAVGYSTGGCGVAGDDGGKEGKDDDGKSSDGEYSSSHNLKEVSRFVARVYDMVADSLRSNASSHAFDSYAPSSAGGRSASSPIKYWNKLSVDLEKYKVVYPDWSGGSYHAGVISRCYATRTKERMYDIEYEDGQRLCGVKEEFIVLTSAGGHDGKSSLPPAPPCNIAVGMRLGEGMRVHVKVKATKGGLQRYMPGRISKTHRASYDVECADGKVERDVPSEDLMLGLAEGWSVEARRPRKVRLQATGLSWSSSGGSIAACYGRLGESGWSTFPGALCVWNVFSKSFTAADPALALDHNSSLSCVQYHPAAPSLLAAGSVNGEILVFDTSMADPLVAVTPILEYGHKDCVKDVTWHFSAQLDEWVIVSCSSDGRVLVWSLRNGLRHPVKGGCLFSSKDGSSRRAYPQTFGATSVCFTSTGSRSQWCVIGQQCGAVVRSPTSRLFDGKALLSEESFRALPQLSEIYVALKRQGDTFAHEPHIGSVNSVDASPFHRNLFLTTGDDGSIRLFNMLERLPLYSWTPGAITAQDSWTTFSRVSSGEFSPSRPLVFAAAAHDGCVHVFDLLQSAVGPVATLSAPAVTAAGPSSEARAQLTAFAFNKRQREFLAACDNNGDVHIWKLSWDLSNRQPREDELLAALGDIVKS